MQVSTTLPVQEEKRLQLPPRNIYEALKEYERPQAQPPMVVGLLRDLSRGIDRPDPEYPMEVRNERMRQAMIMKEKAHGKIPLLELPLPIDYTVIKISISTGQATSPGGKSTDVVFHVAANVLTNIPTLKNLYDDVKITDLIVNPISNNPLVPDVASMWSCLQFADFHMVQDYQRPNNKWGIIQDRVPLEIFDANLVWGVDNLRIRELLKDDKKLLAEAMRFNFDEILKSIPPGPSELRTLIEARRSMDEIYQMLKLAHYLGMVDFVDAIARGLQYQIFMMTPEQIEDFFRVPRGSLKNL